MVAAVVAAARAAGQSAADRERVRAVAVARVARAAGTLVMATARRREGTAVAAGTAAMAVATVVTVVVTVAALVAAMAAAARVEMADRAAMVVAMVATAVDMVTVAEMAGKTATVAEVATVAESDSVACAKFEQLNRSPKRARPGIRTWRTRERIGPLDGGSRVETLRRIQVITVRG